VGQFQSEAQGLANTFGAVRMAPRTRSTGEGGSERETPIQCKAAVRARREQGYCTASLDAMGTLSRRSFNAAGVQALLTSFLFQHAAQADAVEGTLKWSLRPWLQRIDQISGALSSGTIAPRSWQQEIEHVLERVELDDFLRSLDFERLAVGARFPVDGEGMQRLYFPDEAGRLQPLTFRPYLFTLRKGTAVVPHGHHNMATMHMVLDGSARVRHYDKLETSATHMTIRASTDAQSNPGDVTSVSDDHQNIHWFEPLSERVFMFNIGVYNVRPGPFGERDYVDPAGGISLGAGLIRAPRLDRESAYAKYGRV
jgi:hypothetical protein